MRTTILSFFLLFAACGDNLAAGSGADAAPPDGPPDGSATATAFAVAPDFQSGGGIASAVSIPGLEVQTNVLAGAASSDPVVRALGDRIYIVNRFGFDNVTILEKEGFAFVEQVSTGADTNPQDIARANGKLYVAAHDAPGILVIDESNLSAGVGATIDLSALDADDGDPDCATVLAIDGKIVAACQVLDAFFAPRGPGQIAIIDPETDQLETTFPLTYANPFSFLVEAGGEALVATTPSFSDYANGCVERIALAPAPAAAGCLIENDELGGYVSTLAATEGGVFATVITCMGGDCFNNPTVATLIEIDGGATEISGPSSHVTDVAACPSGHLVAGDTDFADEPGLRIYRPAGTELTEAPLDLGLPPGFVNSIACY